MLKNLGLRVKRRRLSLKTGSQAPVFQSTTITGAPFDLAVCVQKAPLLLVFIPNAFTPVCAEEISQLSEIAKAYPHVQVVVISCDSKQVLAAWLADSASQLCAVSDFWQHGRISKLYGSFNSDTGASLRNSFLLDTSGKIIAKIAAAPGQARSIQDYEKALNSLRHA